jgi:hypothetical protein
VFPGYILLARSPRRCRRPIVRANVAVHSGERLRKDRCGTTPLRRM